MPRQLRAAVALTMMSLRPVPAASPGNHSDAVAAMSCRTALAEVPTLFSFVLFSAVLAPEVAASRTRSLRSLRDWMREKQQSLQFVRRSVCIGKLRFDAVC